MGKEHHTLLTWRFSKRTKRDLCIHLIFFWSRVLAIGTLYFFLRFQFIRSSDVMITADDFGYLSQLNLFLFYLVSSSTIRENVFKYYLSIMLMFHNGIIAILMPVFQNSSVTSYNWICYLLIAGFNFIEGFISIYIAIKDVSISNIELFKKVGANPKINNAFSTRKCLETFGEINVFISGFVALKFWIPNTIRFKWLATLEVVHSLLTYVQQLVISTRFNDENVTQRCIAIFLCSVKIPMCIVIIIWENYERVKGDTNVSGFFGFIYVDIVLLSISLTYFLIQDYRQFGSGLKEFLKSKGVILTLNSYV